MWCVWNNDIFICVLIISCINGGKCKILEFLSYIINSGCPVVLPEDLNDFLGTISSINMYEENRDSHQIVGFDDDVLHHVKKYITINLDYLINHAKTTPLRDILTKFYRWVLIHQNI